jgi:hypothetical protein
VPALRDVLKVGRPALVSLNNMLPTLRAFARDALPGTKSSGPTLDASLPFITQARLLVRKQELRGLAHDLKFAIPDLARVNHATIPLLQQQRALSACQNNVLNPFSNTPVPDPDFENKPNDGGSTGQPFKKEAPRGLTGLAGESRIGDSNSPTFHVQFGSGPANVLLRSEGETFLAQNGFQAEGTRPVKPNNRPVFRPGTPCETQQPPDLHAAGGSPDETVASNGIPILPGLPLPPVAKTPMKPKDRIMTSMLQSYLARTMKGEATPDPLRYTPKQYRQLLEKQGLTLSRTGRILNKPGAAKREAVKR